MACASRKFGGTMARRTMAWRTIARRTIAWRTMAERNSTNTAPSPLVGLSRIPRENEKLNTLLFLVILNSPDKCRNHRFILTTCSRMNPSHRSMYVRTWPSGISANFWSQTRDLVALSRQLLGEFKKLVQNFQYCRFTYVEFSGLSVLKYCGRCFAYQIKE